MVIPDETNDATVECEPLMVVGRYAIYGEIASGGMASVHLGRLLGPVGFSRTVAVKRLHAHLSKDPEFTAMFLDEARLAARIRHPNVVATLDVGASKGELFLVMDYVHGVSLGQLLRDVAARKERMPLGIAGTLLSGMLQGLHAAHEARSDRGEPLGIVHRDVSPQNLLVGLDGVPRLVDFGVAKAMGRVSTTQSGQIKGKIGYMAPEQILGNQVNRQTDIWGAGVVLWQVLTGRRLFPQSNDAETLYKIIAAEVPRPSEVIEGIPAEVDAVVLRALAKNHEERFQTAHEMAVACENALPIVSQREVAEWVEQIEGPDLSRMAARVAEIESVSREVKLIPSMPPLKGLGIPKGAKETFFDPFASTVPPPPSIKARRKKPATWFIVAGGAVLIGSIGGVAAGLVVRSGGETIPPANAVASAHPTTSHTPAPGISSLPPLLRSDPVTSTEISSSTPPPTQTLPIARVPAAPKAKQKPKATSTTHKESLYVRE